MVFLEKLNSLIAPKLAGIEVTQGFQFQLRMAGYHNFRHLEF
jgi:hypothetical protein